MPINLAPKKEKPMKPHVERDMSADSGVVTVRSANITTLDAAIKFSKIDLTVWEVERYVVNPWETTMGRKNTGTGKAETYTNFQVKVWLKKKTPQHRACDSILERIKENAKIHQFPRIVITKKHERRALEIDIMDIHMGLKCRTPEADADWDMELAESATMHAIEDLLQKAKVFGPFEQIFMPIGNDFVHSDNVFHTTTAGTGQPEAESWHRVYLTAKELLLKMVSRIKEETEHLYIYEIPGNHSRMADFTLAQLAQAYYRLDKGITIDASPSPYKFHRYGANLIGYEHGHSVNPLRLAALMANERPKDWSETTYREIHLGDQHRKGSGKPSMLEEQGVSVEYLCALTAPNEWHRLKGFNHQKRGATAFVWNYNTGQEAKLLFNLK